MYKLFCWTQLIRKYLEKQNLIKQLKWRQFDKQIEDNFDLMFVESIREQRRKFCCETEKWTKSLVKFIAHTTPALTVCSVLQINTLE